MSRPLARLIRAMPFAALAFTACATRTVQTAAGEVDLPAEVSDTTARILTALPEPQRDIAVALTQKYGTPQVVSADLVGWFHEGPIVGMTILASAAPHNFPIPHTDFLTHTVKYRVPPEKLAELYRFDGSLSYNRTRGELSAQCNNEAMNFLALNLANEIVSGTMTVQEARDFYSQLALGYQAGERMSPYLNGLLFSPNPGAADPDTSYTRAGR